MGVWTGAPATEIAAAVRKGEARAADIVAEHLDHIRSHDPVLRAFRAVREVRVLAEAISVDARADRDRLPLAGVPVAIKDNVAVAGEPMRAGSAATPATPAAADHPVVRRLRDAGAVVVGITMMPELGLFSTGDNAFGIGRNPWLDTVTPGGSSGGGAAAVGSGMVPVALGNDALGDRKSVV